MTHAALRATVDAGSGRTSTEGSLQMRVAGSADALGVESRLIAALREDPSSTIIMPASVVTVTVIRLATP